FDQLVGALVSLPPFSETAVDDLLQMIAARKPAHVFGANAGARIALQQHAEELAHLIHVVSRLPFGRSPGEKFAWRREGIHGSRGDAAVAGLLADDAEITEFQLTTFADEHVDRRQIAMEQLTAVQLAQHIEHSGHLTTDRAFFPTGTVVLQERAQI